MKYLVIALLLAGSLSAQNKYTLDFKDTGVKIQPTMYGIFFEDINYGADGGLYAELVKNRSFEFDTPLMGWDQPGSDRHSLNEKSGYATVVRDDSKTNKNYIRVDVNNDSGYSLVNEGFFGMGIKAGASYDVSVWAAKAQGNISEVRFQLIDAAGNSIGESAVTLASKDWKQYPTVIKATKTEAKAKLKVTFSGKGSVLLDMVSMFPQDTWKGRKGGLRKDLVQKLYDLKPGFLRFPGGCIVEGRILEERYQWKKSVGKVDDRELLVNRWNKEFKHRPAPDYYQTFGLGFYEYFQLAEDLGASPLPILSCGMACQFNTGELVEMHDIDPYVQDALDLIEFANGDVSTKWGKLRSDMGHPKTFDLKFIGVGNEQWGPDYFERYKVFEKAIHGKYPNITIVSGSGPFPNGEYFDYGWKQLKDMKAQIVDEHYYNNPQWFKDNATRYDQYDRKGPKVFAGEYAAQSVAIASPDNKNNWDCALAEAAFMTGLERNAEVVNMCSYAPLFAHAEGWQWTPDLIWFNSLESYKTPNYYVQQLYSNNPGTDLISINDGGKPVTGKNGMFATAVVDKKTNEVIVKIVNTTASAQTSDINLKGKTLSGTATQTTLGNTNLSSENSFTSETLAPKTSEIKASGKNLNIGVPAYSMVVVRAKIK
ncbi:alpha-L-arabinofuranosidase C-terminal domain-containing protein [Flavobacterium silvaticum]|uniref:non-reducing end alpha-L-arabinofuranosidase n=1 Tax=Flavobacterium silvaticum TaxID=1852020 RepID=A0A972FM61_9FLAO|nr:alpha-L-arabinofuranosidase C-terminal domain-containing protein [Flavobacterium silvaticum]NMH28614.1 alpha-L-arabinofuranosidase [Flavobacterium silvaticum]